MSSLQQFLQMGGYSAYVFSAYGCVIIFLGSQWLLSWRRWRRYVRRQAS